MSETAPPTPEQLLRLAHDGDVLGRLLESYRNYLKMLAQLQIDVRLQGKVDASDLVQETFLAAHRDFGAFRGTTEAELLQWLRRVLANRLATLVRRFYTAQCRDVRLERRLDEELNRSSQMARALVASQSTPSQRAARREQGVLLADALQRLPSHYREVVVLRHLRELSFPEVARRMGRSVDSVEKLWVRALATLHRSLGVEADGTS